MLRVVLSTSCCDMNTPKYFLTCETYHVQSSEVVSLAQRVRTKVVGNNAFGISVVFG
jgi:hypothetical protein